MSTYLGTGSISGTTLWQDGALQIRVCNLDCASKEHGSRLAGTFDNLCTIHFVYSPALSTGVVCRNTFWKQYSRDQPETGASKSSVYSLIHCVLGVYFVFKTCLFCKNAIRRDNWLAGTLECWIITAHSKQVDARLLHETRINDIECRLALFRGWLQRMRTRSVASYRKSRVLPVHLVSIHLLVYA